MSELSFASLFFCAALVADVESGPKVGAKIPPLEAFAVVGEVEDKKVDFAARRKDRPTIYVFVNAERWDRPTARFLRKLDEEVAGASDKSSVVAVWIPQDVEKSKEYLPLAQQSLKLEWTALGVAPETGVSPPEWEINANVTVTVVVARQGKTAAVFGFDSVNDADVRRVVAAWRKTTEKPKDAPKKKPAAEKPPAP
jgi:hypothetical protein